MSWSQKVCELSEITGKDIDFSKVKLIPQRDNIDVSKKNGKEKICIVFLYELWILNIW